MTSTVHPRLHFNKYDELPSSDRNAGPVSTFTKPYVLADWVSMYFNHIANNFTKSTYLYAQLFRCPPSSFSDRATSYFWWMIWIVMDGFLTFLYIPIIEFNIYARITADRAVLYLFSVSTLLLFLDRRDYPHLRDPLPTYGNWP